MDDPVYTRGEGEDRLTVLLYGKKLARIEFLDGANDDSDDEWVGHVVDLLNRHAEEG